MIDVRNGHCVEPIPSGQAEPELSRTFSALRDHLMSHLATMIGPDEALALVLREAHRLPIQYVPLAEACGLQLAATVVADRDYPPFSRAMMDGYAVRVADAGQTLKVVGEIAAGQMVTGPCPPRQCFEVMTGAPCPAGTEAVVPKEDAVREGDSVTIPLTIRLGQHIAPQGSECQRGSVVLECGAAITPLAIAVMASFGRNTIGVTPRPSLGVITTGRELAAAGQDPSAAQIRDSNGPMLSAMAITIGLAPPQTLHADDCPTAIRAALDSVADRNIVLLAGGVSVGTYDLVPEALRQYGAEVIFHKVAQKPGKPLLFARRGPQLFFGLPGNPLACHLCFHRYVAAAARQLAGKPAELHPLLGRLTAVVKGSRLRTFYAMARAEPDRSTGNGWLVHPLPGVSSADIFSTCKANCYIEVPVGSEEIPMGSPVRFTWVICPP